jgi:hypothetical protein
MVGTMSFSATKSANYPPTLKKTPFARRQILPLLALETQSELCDTKCLTEKKFTRVTGKEVNLDGKENCFVVGDYPLRIYSNICRMRQERRTSSASTTACASTCSASGTGCSDG